MNRLARLYEKKWSQDVDMKWDAPEGFFNKSAIEIAKGLKKDSKDLKQAMSRLTFYINRAGKNLSKDDKGRLENAKIELKKIYKKQDSVQVEESISDEITHIRAIDQFIFEVGKKTDKRIEPLGQLSINSAIKRFGANVVDHAIGKYATTIDPTEDWIPVDLEKFWADKRKKPVEEARNGTKSLTFSKPFDLGNGIYLHKIGMDANGNKAIWASRGANRSVKFQTNDEDLYFMHNIVIADVKSYLDKPDFRKKLSDAIRKKMKINNSVGRSKMSLTRFVTENSGSIDKFFEGTGENTVLVRYKEEIRKVMMSVASHLTSNQLNDLMLAILELIEIVEKRSQKGLNEANKVLKNPEIKVTINDNDDVIFDLGWSDEIFKAMRRIFIADNTGGSNFGKMDTKINIYDKTVTFINNNQS